jgi:hypothetical protein
MKGERSMRWAIKLLDKNGKLSMLTFNNDEKLGNFIVNYDQSKYTIFKVEEITEAIISNPKYFLKTEKQLEFGKGV